MFFRNGASHVDHGHQGKDVGLQERNEDVEAHEYRGGHQISHAQK